MNLRGKTPIAILTGAILAGSEYFNLGTHLIANCFGGQKNLILASEFVTAAAAWVFALWLLPRVARFIVSMSDKATQLSDRLGEWGRRMLIALFERAIRSLSVQSEASSPQALPAPEIKMHEPAN